MSGERIIRYERDGSVTLIQGERRERLAAGWSDGALDAAANAFFTDEGGDEG